MGAETDALASQHHVVGVYDTEVFLLRTVARHVVQALDDAALAVVLLPAEHHAPLAGHLRDAGTDLAAATRAGQVVMGDSDELIAAMVPPDGVDRVNFRAIAEQHWSSTLAAGGHVRICGDVHSALWRGGGAASVLELEELWNGLLTTDRCTLLCLYQAEVFHDGAGDDRFLALCRQHDAVRPVEDYASLVDPVRQPRSVALLEHQARADERSRVRLVERLRVVEEELDRSVREVSEQREQFGQAVATRDVIGQAKGIIMVRWQIDSETAFEMLRNAARRSRRKVQDVAQAVVEQQLRRT